MVPVFIADGHLQLALENPNRTLELMEDVIQRLRLIGSQNQLAEAYWLRGKAWLTLENVAQAQEAFAKAKIVAEEISERTILR